MSVLMCRACEYALPAQAIALHERLAGKCRWEPRGQGWARSCDDYKETVYAHDMPGSEYCPGCGKQIEEIRE